MTIFGNTMKKVITRFSVLVLATLAISQQITINALEAERKSTISQHDQVREIQKTIAIKRQARLNKEAKAKNQELALK